jgi:2-oxoglutarate dehydrogenase E2 component (dihydrolipoamide succinyltransferase)
MTIDIKAPAFPESVADGEVAAWHKKEGEAVQRDELLVEIETDKVVLEVVAPADGVIEKIHAAEGEVIASEALLATFAAGAAAGETAAVASPAPAQPWRVPTPLRRHRIWDPPRASWWRSTSSMRG